MTMARGTAFALLLLIAATLQVTVFSNFSVGGVVPNLVMLVVIAGALCRGPQFGAVLGFCGGLVLDLIPPADHVAGRWALALMVVGYLASRVRRDARTSTFAAILTVAACSFVSTSIYALTGLVWQDQALPVSQMLPVIGIGMLWDVMLTPVLLPALFWVYDRLRPPQLAYP